MKIKISMILIILFTILATAWAAEAAVVDPAVEETTVEITESLLLTITKWATQIVVILGAVAILDPTNKVAKFNTKLIRIFTMFNVLDKEANGKGKKKKKKR